jgi:hypothetical protein
MQYRMGYQQEQAAAKPVAAATMPVAKAAAVKLTATTGRRRYPPSQGVDPADLTRRLLKVAADQKVYTERKRQARKEAERLANAASSSTDQEQAGKEKEGAGSKSRASAPLLQSVTVKSPGDKPVTLHLRARPKTSHLEPSPSAPYRHVPQQAAAQFIQTATTELMAQKPLTHRPSKKTLKLPEQTLTAVEPNAVSPRKPKTLRKSQSHREIPRERSQAPKTRSLESAIGEHKGTEKEPKLQFRHTYGPTRSGATNLDRHRSMRRMSTGDLLSSHDARRQSSAVTAENQSSYPWNKVMGQEGLILPETIQEHRVDWSQSDEPVAKTKPRISPLLRKADSIWTLRGRLGSFTKHGKEDRAPMHPEKGSTATEAPKTPMAGFLSRFKR